MTALLDRAIAQVRALPEPEQDAYASLLLTALDPDLVAPMDAATRQAIREGLSQAERGEFASDAEMTSLLDDRKP